VILVTKDEYYLGIALTVAKKSACLKKQHGAVIVKNDEIVSTGYNGNCRGEPHCLTCTKVKINKDEAEYLTCKSVHAEMNAIISASRNEMLGATLYLAGYITSTGEENLNVEPCEICLRLIKNAGIDKVVTNRGVIYERHLDGILRRA
jgi:dCMP deaminase